MAPRGAHVDPARRRKVFCPPRRRLAPGDLGERAAEALAALAGTPAPAAPAAPAAPRPAGDEAGPPGAKRPRPPVQATLHNFHTTRGMAAALTTIRPLERRPDKEGGSAGPSTPAANAEGRGAEPPQGSHAAAAAAGTDAAVPEGLPRSTAAAPSGLELLPACPEPLGPGPNAGPLLLLPRGPAGPAPQQASGRDAYLAATVASVATQLAGELEPRRPRATAGPPAASPPPDPGGALWWGWKEHEGPRLGEPSSPPAARGALPPASPDSPRAAPSPAGPGRSPPRAAAPRAPPDFAGAGGRWGRWCEIAARLQGKRPPPPPPPPRGVSGRADGRPAPPPSPSPDFPVRTG